jgi:hypothetical protein
MKIAALTWDSTNIGDDVQTIAVTQHLPRVDFYLRREELKSYDGPECLLVMNGWFRPTEQNWPPSDKIHPIFFGFHSEPVKVLDTYKDYLKRHAPIGCRDRGTMIYLQSLGIDAYLSLCATLTFEPFADRNPKNLFLIDARANFMESSIREALPLQRRTVSHNFFNEDLQWRLSYAKSLMEAYGKTAGMVITNRIHAAMPCVAMGIPVVFIAERNSRREIVEEFGLPIHDPSGIGWRLGLTKIREWPKPLDITEVKQRIKADLLGKIDVALKN